jgi:putative cardiolipin synthase
MNFDPRSVNINTEAGAFVDSPALAADLARLIERNMQPENAWHVTLDADGDPQWQNSEEVIHRQPARSAWQRVMKLGPKAQY